MHTIRLLYASRAKPAIEFSELSAIMESAAVRNAALGITGILCCSSGAFLQALEGPRAAVNTLYNRIVTDPRHSDTQVLGCASIDSRHFSDWSMKLVSWDDGYTLRRRELVLRHCGEAVFDPFRLGEVQAERFLRDLAELERLPRRVDTTQVFTP